MAKFMRLPYISSQDGSTRIRNFNLSKIYNMAMDDKDSNITTIYNPCCWYQIPLPYTKVMEIYGAAVDGMTIGDTVHFAPFCHAGQLNLF